MISVDTAHSCIDLCYAGFPSEPRARSKVTDGATLPMVTSSRIDFCLSFDALALAGAATIKSYLAELRRSCGQTARLSFIFPTSALMQSVPEVTAGENLFWRDRGVDTVLVADAAADLGLSVITQETIRWVRG